MVLRGVCSLGLSLKNNIRSPEPVSEGALHTKCATPGDGIYIVYSLDEGLRSNSS